MSCNNGSYSNESYNDESYNNQTYKNESLLLEHLRNVCVWMLCYGEKFTKFVSNRLPRPLKIATWKLSAGHRLIHERCFMSIVYDQGHKVRLPDQRDKEANEKDWKVSYRVYLSRNYDLWCLELFSSWLQSSLCRLGNVNPNNFGFASAASENEDWESWLKLSVAKVTFTLLKFYSF